jgi:hypothetical protein
MQKNNVELQKQIKIHDSKIFMVVTNEAADEHTRFSVPQNQKDIDSSQKKQNNQRQSKTPRHRRLLYTEPFL